MSLHELSEKQWWVDMNNNTPSDFDDCKYKSHYIFLVRFWYYSLGEMKIACREGKWDENTKSFSNIHELKSESVSRVLWRPIQYNHGLVLKNKI